MKFEFPTFRRAFLTGLLVLAPLGVTAWVFTWLFRSVDNLMRPVLMKVPAAREWLPEEGIIGLGFVAAIAIVMIVGLFANNLLGRAVFGNLDRALARIPWIKAVYGATKEISGVVFSERGQAFRKVVVFAYPRPGTYSVGFVTLEHLPESERSGYLHVFLPTSPNPTSGYFLLVPAEDAIELEGISVEEGLKLIVSGGSVISPTASRAVSNALHSLRSR